MRRRALLFGLGGAAVSLGVTRTAFAATTSSGTTGPSASASAIMSSTQDSTLVARPVTHVTPVPGHFPGTSATVSVADYELSLPTRVWYPAGEGRHGVILFSHGLLSQPGDYASLLSAWARAGYVVAAPLYPHTSFGTSSYNIYDIANQPKYASAVLTEVLALNTTAGPLRGRLDAARVVAAGHSAGGITTTGLFSEYRDDRLKAGVVLAGTDFLGTPFAGPPAPMLFVQGRDDDTVSWNAAHTVFRAVPWSRAMLTVTDGGHQLTSADEPAVVATSTEFLRWSLYGGTPALSATTGVTTLEQQL